MASLPTKPPTVESTIPKTEKPKDLKTPTTDAAWPANTPQVPPQKKPQATSTLGVRDKETGGIIYDTSKKSHLILVSEILQKRAG